VAANLLDRPQDARQKTVGEGASFGLIDGACRKMVQLRRSPRTTATGTIWWRAGAGFAHLAARAAAGCKTAFGL